MKLNRRTVILPVNYYITLRRDASRLYIIVSRTKDIDHLKTLYKITDRELEVIRQLAIGKTNKDIAAFLNITNKTIESHIANIYNKLLIKNRIELINILSEFNSADLPQ